MEYEMSIGVASATEASKQYRSSMLKLSNARRIAKSDDLELKAELVGDLKQSQEPPSLANKILLIPSEPDDHHMVHDKTGQYHLLVEREQISFSGDDCNKIGTSYSAFNNQPGDACGQPLGTCLKNQILDVYEADMQRIS
jgi:hypothetical protein